LIAGVSVVTIRGINPDVGTTPEDVIPWGGFYAWQDTPVSLEVVSTSAADGIGGTGLRTILVEGLDNNFLPLSEVVELKGTSVVPLANQYRRVNRLVGVTAGSALQGVGTIDARVAGGGAIQQRILANESISRAGIYTIPANCNGHTFRVVVSIRQSGANDMTLMLRGRNLAVPDSPFISGGDINVMGAEVMELSTARARQPGPMDMHLRTSLTTATSSQVAATVDMFLEQLWT
jgi:hypothetical protein